MSRKFLMGEPVKIARPFGDNSLRGETAIVTSMPRPAVFQGNLVTQYAVELHDKVIWINEAALDKMEVTECTNLSIEC